MAKKPKSFPKTVYVRWEDEGSGEDFLVAYATTDAAQDGQYVAIYTLKEVKQLRETRTLV